MYMCIYVYIHILCTYRLILDSDNCGSYDGKWQATGSNPRTSIGEQGPHWSKYMRGPIQSNYCICMSQMQSYLLIDYLLLLTETGETSWVQTQTWCTDRSRSRKTATLNIFKPTEVDQHQFFYEKGLIRQSQRIMVFHLWEPEYDANLGSVATACGPPTTATDPPALQLIPSHQDVAQQTHRGLDGLHTRKRRVSLGPDQKPRHVGYGYCKSFFPILSTSNAVFMGPVPFSGNLWLRSKLISCSTTQLLVVTSQSASQVCFAKVQHDVGSSVLPHL